MVEKIELVKAELAFHGIRVLESGQCFSFMEGEDQPVQSTCREKMHELKAEIAENKHGVRAFWDKMCKLLASSPQGMSTGGSPSTEKMFVASLKHMLRFGRRYKYFNKHSEIIKAALRKDVKGYTESTMSKVVDYKICIEWLDHLVRHGAWCCKLLVMFEQNRGTVTAQQMIPSGTMDMEGDEHDPLKERRWAWDDEDFDHSREHNTSVAPKSGFFFVETDPTQGVDSLYDLGDENDPYGNKHYYNFKSKVHRGIDS